jgi:hypothetical protein
LQELAGVRYNEDLTQLWAVVTEQVMLAQQRTLIHVVEQVNEQHVQAAAAVAQLCPSPAHSPFKQAPEQQEVAEHQLAQERCVAYRAACGRSQQVFPAQASLASSTNEPSFPLVQFMQSVLQFNSMDAALFLMCQIWCWCTF